MKYLLIVLFFFSVLTVQSQNLVPNPGFEAHSQCPITLGNIYTVLNWYQVVGHLSTPDYYNVCGDKLNRVSVPDNTAGYQMPFDGDAYVGIFCYQNLGIGTIREYIQNRLISPLIDGQWYRISFFTNLGDISSSAVNNIGAALTNESIQGVNTFGNLNVTPAFHATEIISDSVNWTQVTGYYKAHGGEQFITLGNFYSDEQTSKKDLITIGGGSAYYLIDAVSVTATDAPACTAPIVYPNPTAGQINITTACQNIRHIKVYNAIAQLVKEINGNISSIDVGAFPAGMYLLVMTTDENKRFVKRIIKTNH
ncbi:MAG: T9SS type A sorting domain-containing protein [Ferruginibacter sp.]|jgi:OOP family OmpA-OmpF porin